MKKAIKCSAIELYGLYLYVHPKGYKSWRVVINLGVDNKVYKTFAFIKYGSEELAYLAAQSFRDEMVLKYPPDLNRESRVVTRNTNTSGYVGVYKRSGGKQKYWVAQTQMHNGKHVRKFFNIGALGKDVALKLALEARQLQLKQMANRQYRCESRERLYLDLCGRKETP